MAIKGGDLIHVGNQIVIDRAQTAGPGQVNIPTEKIYELGNYYSIAQVRDTPDLSFSLESLDVSAEIESMLTGNDFTTLADKAELNLAKSLPIDVASEFKAGFTKSNAYDVVGSVSMPYLVLESMSYRFGISDKATQAATLRGDSIFYNPGSTYIQEEAGTNAADQPIVLAHPAFPYNGDTTAGVRYALSVALDDGTRLSYGSDFSEAATGSGTSRAVTVTIKKAVPTARKIRISYASDVVASYPQGSLDGSVLGAHAPVSATRPAAIKGRDIEVFVGGVALVNRWTSVQSVNLDYRVTLNKDEEFGNSQVVSQDFDVPEVSGSVDLKPRDAAELYDKVAQIAGLSTRTEVAGALSSVALPLTVVLHSPTDGTVLKTLHVPDARFTLPGYSGQVQQKLTVTLNFDSDTGSLSIFKGKMPAA